MSTSFGQWYDDQKAGETGESSSGWFGAEQMLPLFDAESMQHFSLTNMKSAMEAQMPKKIMGMGYQQRFQVNDANDATAFNHFCKTYRVLSMACFFYAGLLWFALFIRSLFRLGILCWNSDNGSPSTQIFLELFHGFVDVYEFVWYFEGTDGAFAKHVSTRSHAIYYNLPWLFVLYSVLYVFL